ncbi:MAG: transporter [Bacteroidetes bacterium]|nr:transporter [Bacteroidota bacterium]
MSVYDYIVVACYLLFVSSLGFIFRKFSKDSSDFFRGGGTMLWWLVGATAFMTQFSAWTFIGAASKAYLDGTLVMVIFFANGIGYFFTFLWSGAKFRQTRSVTPMEAIRDRFGKGNEQFFTWISLPIGIFYAGIWLNAISSFVSVVFGMDLYLTIVVVGLVVLFVASLGGSWAVVASDFMQVMILMPLSLVAAFLAIRAVGGGDFFEGAFSFMDKLPANHLNWTEIIRPEIVYLWVFAMILKQFCTTNNLADSYRFLYSKDSKNARRAGLLAAVLFFIGPIIWFIPPMAAAILYPDLSVIPELRSLGSHISEGAYVAIGLETMPMGMIGLMVSAIFAATISSMDSGLNKNAGIFIRNFYKPILRQNAPESEYVFVGRMMSVFFGILVIISALFIENIQVFGLFDVMQLFSSMVAIPFVVPLIWGLIFKKTPKWIGWSTVLVGMLSSLYVKFGLNPSDFAEFVGMVIPITTREYGDYLLLVTTFFNITITSIWFLTITLYAKFFSKKEYVEEEKFFEQMNTPVYTDPAATKDADIGQLKALARLCVPYGSFIILMMFIPNELVGRLCFLFTGSIIAGVGGLLYWKARIIKRKYGKNEIIECAQ